MSEKPEDIKSGDWIHPQQDDAGQLRVIHVSEPSPEMYRQRCRILAAKGFRPVGGMPVDTGAVEIVDVEHE